MQVTEVLELQSAARAAGVAPRESLPFLDLPEAGGRRVQTSRFRGRRNLVLLLIHSGKCPYCQATVQSLVSAHRDMAAEEAELPVGLHASLSEADKLPAVAGIPSWLRFIEVQCPECGAPEWPG